MQNNQDNVDELSRSVSGLTLEGDENLMDVDESSLEIDSSSMEIDETYPPFSPQEQSPEEQFQQDEQQEYQQQSFHSNQGFGGSSPNTFSPTAQQYPEQTSQPNAGVERPLFSNLSYAGSRPGSFLSGGQTAPQHTMQQNAGDAGGLKNLGGGGGGGAVADSGAPTGDGSSFGPVRPSPPAVRGSRVSRRRAGGRQARAENANRALQSEVGDLKITIGNLKLSLGEKEKAWAVMVGSHERLESAAQASQDEVKDLSQKLRDALLRADDLAKDRAKAGGGPETADDTNQDSLKKVGDLERELEVYRNQRDPADYITAQRQTLQAAEEAATFHRREGRQKDAELAKWRLKASRALAQLAEEAKLKDAAVAEAERAKGEVATVRSHFNARIKKLTEHTSSLIEEGKELELAKCKEMVDHSTTKTNRAADNERNEKMIRALKGELKRLPALLDVLELEKKEKFQLKAENAEVKGSMTTRLDSVHKQVAESDRLVLELRAEIDAKMREHQSTVRQLDQSKALAEQRNSELQSLKADFERQLGESGELGDGYNNILLELRNTSKQRDQAIEERSQAVMELAKAVQDRDQLIQESVANAIKTHNAAFTSDARIARQEVEKITQERDQAIQQMNKAVQDRDTAIQEVQAKALQAQNAAVTHEAEKALQKMNQITQERDRAVQEQQKAVQERDRAVQEANAKAAQGQNTTVSHEVEKTLQDRERVIKERDHTIQELQKVVQERDRAIQEANAKSVQGQDTTVTVPEAGKAIRDTDTLTKERDNAVQELQKAVQEREKAVQERERAVQERVTAVQQEQAKGIKEREAAVQQEQVKAVQERETAVQQEQAKALQEKNDIIQQAQQAIGEREKALQEAQAQANQHQEQIYKEANGVIQEKEDIIKTQAEGMAAKIESLMNEIASLEKRLKETTTQHERLVQLSKDDHAAWKENENLLKLKIDRQKTEQGEMERQYRETVSKLEYDSDKNNQIIASLERKAEKVDYNAEDHRLAREKFEEEKETARNNIAGLTDRNTELRDQLKEAKKQVLELNNELLKLQKSTNEKVVELETTQKTLRDSEIQLEKNKDERQELYLKLEKLRSYEDEMKDNHPAMKELNTQVERLLQEAADKETELRELRRQMKSCETVHVGEMIPKLEEYQAAELERLQMEDDESLDEILDRFVMVEEEPHPRWKKYQDEIDKRRAIEEAEEARAAKEVEEAEMAKKLSNLMIVTFQIWPKEDQSTPADDTASSTATKSAILETPLGNPSLDKEKTETKDDVEAESPAVHAKASTSKRAILETPLGNPSLDKEKTETKNDDEAESPAVQAKASTSKPATDIQSGVTPSSIDSKSTSSTTTITSATAPSAVTFTQTGTGGSSRLSLIALLPFVVVFCWLMGMWIAVRQERALWLEANDATRQRVLTIRDGHSEVAMYFLGFIPLAWDGMFKGLVFSVMQNHMGA